MLVHNHQLSSDQLSNSHIQASKPDFSFFTLEMAPTNNNQIRTPVFTPMPKDYKSPRSDSMRLPLNRTSPLEKPIFTPMPQKESNLRNRLECEERFEDTKALCDTKDDHTESRPLRLFTLEELSSNPDTILRNLQALIHGVEEHPRKDAQLCHDSDITDDTWSSLDESQPDEYSDESVGNRCQHSSASDSDFSDDDFEEEGSLPKHSNVTPPD